MLYCGASAYNASWLSEQDERPIPEGYFRLSADLKNYGNEIEELMAALARVSEDLQGESKYEESAWSKIWFSEDGVAHWKSVGRYDSANANGDDDDDDDDDDGYDYENAYTEDEDEDGDNSEEEIL